MPSIKTLERKKAVVNKISEKLRSSCAGVIVSYKGINVESDTELRKKLRESQVDYMVVKNTLLRRAAEDAGISGLSTSLKGSTALAVSKCDYVAASKILCEFAKDHDFFEVKSGFIDSKVIDNEEVLNLSRLPSRDVLIAQVLGGLNAPIQGFATVLHGTLKSFAIVLQAIADKQNA